MTVYSETDGIFFRVFTPEEQRDRESRGISVKEYPAGDLSFLFEIPAVYCINTYKELLRSIYIL